MLVLLPLLACVHHVRPSHDHGVRGLPHPGLPMSDARAERWEALSEAYDAAVRLHGRGRHHRAAARFLEAADAGSGDPPFLDEQIETACEMARTCLAFSVPMPVDDIAIRCPAP